MACAWNVCLVFCVVVWCAVSSCAGVGAGVQCAFVARGCLCGVARLGTRETTRVRPKRLRVYCQNARTSSTCGRFAGAHGDVLDVHTEGFFPLSPLLSLLSHSLSVFLFLSSSLLHVSLALALAFPSESTKQPLSGNFIPYSKIAPQGKIRFRTFFTLLKNSSPWKKRSSNHYLIQK